MVKLSSCTRPDLGSWGRSQWVVRHLHLFFVDSWTQVFILMRHLDLCFKPTSNPPRSQRFPGSSLERWPFTLAGFQNLSSAAYPPIESSSSLRFMLFCYSLHLLLSSTDFFHYDPGTSSLCTQFLAHFCEMSMSTQMMPPTHGLPSPGALSSLHLVHGLTLENAQTSHSLTKSSNSFLIFQLACCTVPNLTVLI